MYFSNQEYYRRLEELKRAHLRNMAELERMYISQGREREWRREEDDGGLGGREGREERLSVRLVGLLNNREGKRSRSFLHDLFSDISHQR